MASIAGYVAVFDIVMFVGLVAAVLLTGINYFTRRGYKEHDNGS